MKKGDEIKTTTKVLDEFSGFISDKYFGTATLMETYIEEVTTFYVIEFDVAYRGDEIRKVVYLEEDRANTMYKTIVKDILGDMMNHIDGRKE